MTIRQIVENKKQYLPLLLLGDEQEDMIDRYLDRGALFLLEEDGPIGVLVVTEEGEGLLEVKNLAVDRRFQGKGYGRKLLTFAEDHYRGRYHTIQLGTGDSPLTLPFYEKCGYRRFMTIPNFFTDHYDHPMIEAGVTLRDMIYLKKEL